MTKEDLKNKLIESEEKIKELEQDVEYWQDEYYKMEEIKDDLDCRLADLEMKGGINDLELFIERMKIEGLYFEKFQSFLDYYLNYFND